ncbi:uncharacterized protein LOC117116907 isoform X2 [Anneissia japonica]|uniref:uncharacterized protein LOC117116907 isoform X2 n=1 Tax=Anneissia japonica TaxID=1529436 RepID=UPI00142564BE|nr:uncharacterized protein LOC117116907 isoform X2 [Anneissia japonica]
MDHSAKRNKPQQLEKCIGTYVAVDPCFLLPCPTNLICYAQESKCILTCRDNLDFCPNGECKVNDNGKNLTCNNDVTVDPTSNTSHEMVIALVLICASVFLVVLSLVLFVIICKLWRKRRQRRLRQNRNIQQPFGFEDNKHIRLNGGISMTNFSHERYLVEIAEPIETPFFSRHPTDPNLTSRGSIGSVDQHSIFDRAFSSAPQSDLDEHDYDYDVTSISRNRSVTFSETPQILGDDQSVEVFGIENFSFGVPKYVDREDDGGSYRVRWDFKVDDPDTDMDIAL